MGYVLDVGCGASRLLKMIHFSLCEGCVVKFGGVERYNGRSVNR